MPGKYLLPQVCSRGESAGDESQRCVGSVRREEDVTRREKRKRMEKKKWREKKRREKTKRCEQSPRPWPVPTFKGLVDLIDEPLGANDVENGGVDGAAVVPLLLVACGGFIDAQPQTGTTEGELVLALCLGRPGVSSGSLPPIISHTTLEIS